MEFRPLTQAFRPAYPAGSQVVAVSAVSAQSTAMPAHIKLDKISVEQNSFIEIGASPTAVVNTSMYLEGGLPHYVPVFEGEVIAFVESSASGNAFITPLSK